jgi:moderate conductance mechanosensitive channel
MDIASSLAGLLSRSAALDEAAAALLARVVSMVLTLAVLFVAYRLALRVVDRVLGPQAGRPARVRTVGALLENLARWVFGFVVLLIVLRELGIDVRGLLVSAGLVGLAVGLGAQTLIRDVIAGIFLVFEGVMGVDDLIEIGGRQGTVELVGLRVTRFRLLDGSLRVIPNGQLTEFVNLSTEWARAVVEVAVPPGVAISRALEVLEAAGQEWARAGGAALESPRAQGIIRWSGADSVLRLAVKVPAAQRLDVEAELRRRIKDAFDREHLALTGPS